MTIIAAVLLTSALAGSADTTMKATVAAVDTAKGGSRIHISRGSEDGVEVGDRGAVYDGDRLVTRFTIDTVAKKKSFAFVPVRPDEAKSLKSNIEIELTPGTTPPTLSSKQLGAAPLGSCADDYTMYKAGRISSWIPRPDGKVRMLWIDDLGWRHRVCGDATGMVYAGGVGDRFLTDAADVKIRLRVVDLGWRRTLVEVIQGDLDETLLGNDRLVVFRAKKK